MAEQVARVICFLLHQRNIPEMGVLFQRFEWVLADLVADIEEVPGDEPVQQALTLFQQQKEMMHV